MGLEERQQAGERKTSADPVEMTVGSDTARPRQRGEELLHPGNRRQLVLKGGGRAGGKCFEKRVRQRSSELDCDGSGEGRPVFAEAECDGLVDRRREIDSRQALGENAGEDQFAVDQHTVAIEDDELRQR